MRIAVYARVSTERQDTQAQNHVIAEWLAKRTPTSVVRFEDEQSGKDDNRPGLAALKAAVERGEIDTVVTYRLDRLSRRSVTALRLLLDWLHRGVGVVCVDQPALNLGLDNPLRLTIAAVFSDLAELERAAIVSRVRSGLAAAKARGVRLGALPKLTPEQQAQARTMLAAGRTATEIAAQFGVHRTTIGNLRRRA